MILYIIAKGKFASAVSELAQRALQIADNWCWKQQLSINAQKTAVVAYAKIIVLTGLRPLVLGGEGIPYVSEVKYLGVIFDQKLTRNSHITNIAQKVAISLRRRRRLCGKNWGLQQKMMLWLYTRVIIPMISTEQWQGGRKPCTWEHPSDSMSFKDEHA